LIRASPELAELEPLCQVDQPTQAETASLLLKVALSLSDSKTNLRRNLFCLAVEIIAAFPSSQAESDRFSFDPLFVEFLDADSIAIVIKAFEKMAISDQFFYEVVRTPYFQGEFQKSFSPTLISTSNSLPDDLQKVWQNPQLCSQLVLAEISDVKICKLMDSAVEKLPVESHLHVYRKLPRDLANLIFRKRLLWLAAEGGSFRAALRPSLTFPQTTRWNPWIGSRMPTWMMQNGCFC
jgi:hypothetical protein